MKGSCAQWAHTIAGPGRSGLPAVRPKRYTRAPLPSGARNLLNGLTSSGTTAVPVWSARREPGLLGSSFQNVVGNAGAALTHCSVLSGWPSIDQMNSSGPVSSRISPTPSVVTDSGRPLPHEAILVASWSQATWLVHPPIYIRPSPSRGWTTSWEHGPCEQYAIASPRGDHSMQPRAGYLVVTRVGTGASRGIR